MAPFFGLIHSVCVCVSLFFVRCSVWLLFVSLFCASHVHIVHRIVCGIDFFVRSCHPFSLLVADDDVRNVRHIQFEIDTKWIKKNQQKKPPKSLAQNNTRLTTIAILCDAIMIGKGKRFSTIKKKKLATTSSTTATKITLALPEWYTFDIWIDWVPSIYILANAFLYGLWGSVIISECRMSVWEKKNQQLNKNYKLFFLQIRVFFPLIRLDNIQSNQKGWLLNGKTTPWSANHKN